MPNYYRDRYNDFIAGAADIYDYLSDNYMDTLENHLLDQGVERISLGRMQFVRVLRYRRTESSATDFETIGNAMRANLRYCSGIGAAFGYFIVSQNREIGIYLAAEGASANRLVTNITASIPDVTYKIGFIPQHEVSSLAAHAGVINGNIECDEVAVDRILSALSDIDGIISVLAVPMETQELSSYISELSNLKRISQDLMNDNADQNRRVNRRSYSFVPEVDSLLDQMVEYYSNRAEQYWKYSIWFGCRNRASLSILGNAVTAAFNGSNHGQLGKARCYYTVVNPLRNGELSLPTADYSNCSYHFEAPIYKPSLLSYISTTGLAGLLQFPSYSVNGFEVIELEKDSSSVHLFDTDYSRYTEESIELGVHADSGIPFSVSINDLKEHVLITGATGAGKTNTVIGLAKGVCKAGIPLLIIEPSKKDYWRLASEIRDMKIYSFGQDAEMLKINPLMPEEGTILANHVDSLLHVFSGAFEMEPPTRFAMDGLLKYTYEHFGWHMSDIAHYSGNLFPKLRDLLFLLPEYVESHLPYGDEVKNNIYGSLFNRLSMLTSGVIGESVNADNCLSGRDLCSGTVLVELDDLSLETKPFMAMLLMTKVEQHLRQGDASSTLRNVIVLEEAHNIFANVSENLAGSTKKMASDSFSNMLSQIREYGTGIIIADQGASQINDTAVSNTKVKIIHGIVDRNDIEKVAFALNLTDIQKRMFPSLTTGEAIVSVRGKREVSRVKINRALYTSIQNIACVLCPLRSQCASFNVPVNQSLPRRLIYSQEIFKHRFNSERLKNTLDSVATHVGWPANKRLCLLGHLLADESIRCGEREKRRIIRTYQNAMEG